MRENQNVDGKLWEKRIKTTPSLVPTTRFSDQSEMSLSQNNARFRSQASFRNHGVCSVPRVRLKRRLLPSVFARKKKNPHGKHVNSVSSAIRVEKRV